MQHETELPSCLSPRLISLSPSCAKWSECEYHLWVLFKVHVAWTLPGTRNKFFVYLLPDMLLSLCSNRIKRTFVYIFRNLSEELKFFRWLNSLSACACSRWM
jgi:hypothetical protein